MDWLKHKKCSRSYNFWNNSNTSLGNLGFKIIQGRLLIEDLRYLIYQYLFCSNLLLWDFHPTFWRLKSRIDLPNQDQVFLDFLAKGRYNCQLWCVKEVLGKYKHKNDLKFKEYYFVHNMSTTNPKSTNPDFLSRNYHF